MSRAGRRVGIPGVLGAALSGVLTVLLAGGAAGQDPALVAYDASSSAMGVQVELEVPGAPISSNLFDGGGPLAQAGIDGLGTSQGYAALPYPGDTVNTLPGLVLPLLGLPALPPYPLQVSSQNLLRPQDDVSLGALSLRASSDDLASSALARAGGGSTGLFVVGTIEAAADAVADPDTLDVTATAHSSVESLSIAGVLSIGSVRASATAVRGADGVTEASSTFEVDGLTVAGLHLGLSDEGILLPGSSVPLLGTDGLSPVLDPLGITLEVLPQDEFDGGVRSRGLAITIPAPGTLAQGRITLTLGRATATSTSAAALPEPALGSVDPGGATAPAPAAPRSPASPASVALPSGIGSTGPGAASPAAPVVSPVAVAAGAVETLRVSSFYLVLVGGAFAGVVSTALLRTFGVKLAWIG